MSLSRRIRFLHKALRRVLCYCLLLSQLTTPGVAAKQVAEDFTLNLNDVDIGVFIKTVAEITGQNFVIDPRVKGRITVITATPSSAEQIHQIFLSTLQVNGYAAVPAGDVIKIVPDALIKQVTSGFDQRAIGDELVTRIVQVQNIDVKDAVSTLRPLLPSSAHMSSHPEARMIVLAGTAATVQRMARIIARIDRGSYQDVEMIELTHLDAHQAVRTLRSLLKDQSKRGGGEHSSPNLVAFSHTNSILIGGSSDERNRVHELVKRLDVPAANTRGAQVIYLNHAVAAELQKVLKGLGDKLAAAKAETSGRGDYEILADEATNALIITAPGEIMSELQSVIAKLDVPREQVQVEGIIAEISSDKAAELGLEWQTSMPGNGFGVTSIAQVANSATSSLDAFPATLGPGISIGYFAANNLRALLKALATDSATKILSTPTVVTLDNKQAYILVGENVPIITGQFTNNSGNDTNPFQTIERRDVGIKLTVTPQINEGNNVRLAIRQEVSAVKTDSSAGFITTERTIETTVQVDDGEIIALGGLISDDVAEQKSAVPVVGSIPIVGEIFTSRRSTQSRKNLVVFLRPTILGRDGRRIALAKQRYQQMRQLQLEDNDAQRAPALLPKQRAATLPAYPPDPDKPIISLPATPSPENGASRWKGVSFEYQPESSFPFPVE